MPIHRAIFQRRLLDQLWLVGFVALPLIFTPLRYEGYESPRAMISILLGVGIVLAALPVRFLSFPAGEGFGVRANRGFDWRALLRQPLVLAVVVWVICMMISAILSLSPSRSIFGDLQRRMGALTQLSLIAAFAGGALVTQRTRARCWRLLAITAVFIAGYAVLQRLGLSPFVPGWILRPSGTIGAAPFAGTWAVTALLWLVVAVIAGSTRYRRVYLAGIIALLVLLVLTQARGALLGLGAGGVTLAANWLIFQGKRRLAGLIVLGAVVILAFGIGVYLGVVQVEQLSGRLRASEDRTGQFRLELWRSTLQLFREWPIMIDAGGQGDRLSALRPFFGYGQEMYEFVERRYIDDDLRATYPETEFIDRAHNLWLDALATQGIIGLLALIGVYSAAAVTCVRMLSSRPHPQNYGEGQWIAAATLAILIAHIVDLQFSFPSVAGEWPFWASLGMLCGALSRPGSSRRWPEAQLDRRAPMMLPMLAWIITWGLASVTPNPLERLALSALCIGLLTCGLALLVWHIERRAYDRVIIASALAALTQYVITGLMSANPQADRLALLLLIDHGIFVIVLVAITIRCLRLPAPGNRGGNWQLIGIALIAGIFFLLDATADSLLAMSGRVPQTARPAIYVTAVTFKTYDDRLLHLAAQGLADTVFAAPVAQSQIAEAQSWLERASVLNSYDANITIQRARHAIVMALVTQEKGYLDSADSWFALAVRQWPNNPALWIERAQFVLNIRQQPVRAIEFASQAQRLTRTAPGSDRLIGDANRVLLRIIEAEQAFRRALKADPKDSAASLALSQLLIDRGDLRGAKGILMRALQRSTLTLKRIQVLTALVRVIEEQGDPGLALRYVNSALSIASNPVDRARLLETRARLQEKSRTR